MTLSEKLEIAIDMATATNDWNAAGKLIVWAFESEIIDAETAVKYRKALARLVATERGKTRNEFSGPNYRATLAKQPLRAWANK